MAIRLTLECGHVSLLRERSTPEGYTHDWEVFVRGVDNADIHHYVDKVVFHLHQTFPKPKRVIKEPPYVVKESGYAGFEIPIDLYLKNKDEPKKIQIHYDLYLQTDESMYNNVIRHSEIINNPSDDFRKKLLKGGATLVSNSESLSDRGDAKASMVSKPKFTTSDTKKHRLVEPKTSNSFADLFGPPIKTAKISPESKKTAQFDKSSVVKSSSTTEKLDKTSKSKDSPHKDVKKEKIDEKKDKKVKDPPKEKIKNKEKSKRSSSPGSKSHSSPASKRPSSPVSIKKPSSPSLSSSTKRPPSPKPKEKDLKKSLQDKEKEREKDKDRDKDKVRENFKSLTDATKTEKKKEKKKHKEDRDKERKDKYKDGERTSSKETQKTNEKKVEKVEKLEKVEKEKVQDYKSTKDGRKSPKPSKETEKIKEEKALKVEKFEKNEKSDKVRDNKSDRDRQKHKHKKKDKKEKRDSSKERERKDKREKSKSREEKQNNAPMVQMTNPLSTLLAEMPERDSSDSAPSVDDDSFAETKAVSVKKEMEESAVPVISNETARPLSPPPMAEIKKEKSERSSRKEKSKGSKEEKESRKRKRRSESKGDEEHSVKREKDRSHSASPLLEPVSSSQSPVVVEMDSMHHTKDKEDRTMLEHGVKKEGEGDAEQVAPDSTNCTLTESDIGEPPVFSEDYVSQLKDLQHKIMTLQDNQELQRVVQVIAETGQYEITKKTFDFDLCALDRRTVQRLQQFFPAS